MKSRMAWFLAVASIGVGCGLVKVNGKPLGSSSSSSAPEASPASAPSAQQASSGAPPTTTPASAPAARPGKTLDDLAKPGAKHRAWTPLQQYLELKTRDLYAVLVDADELGDKLSNAGRLAVIEMCMKQAPRDDDAAAGFAAMWAACGADVEAFSLDGFASELKQEGIGADTRTKMLDDAKQLVAAAKALGSKLTAIGDSGIAAIIGVGNTARKEWAAFATAHAQDLATLDELQDLLRESKNGLAGDCIAKTQPVFVKVARAAKWGSEVETSFDHTQWYLQKLPNTLEAHTATLAWSACAALVHGGGISLYNDVGSTTPWMSSNPNVPPRYVRRGPRTLTIAKLFEDKFEPKFGDRTLTMHGMKKPDVRYRPGITNTHNASGTPSDAVIGKLVKNGDETTIVFAAETVMRCVDWRDTNKISNITPSGDVMYEKKCMKREPDRAEYSDVVIGSAFTGGLAKGVEVVTVSGFPVIAFKGNKAVAVFGAKLR
jgi:hypothetical protein